MIKYKIIKITVFMKTKYKLDFVVKGITFLTNESIYGIEKTKNNPPVNTVVFKPIQRFEKS